MLSAGQKRRLALARLALSGAPLWLLDEPTLGLDTPSVERFGGMLAAHRAGGGMVVAATHVPLPLPGARVAAEMTRLPLQPSPASRERECDGIPLPRRAGSGVCATAHHDPSSPSWPANCGFRCATAPTPWRRCCSSCSTASLFPLAIGPAPETLGRIAPGIVWVCALLAALLPLDRLFGADFEDGSLDQLLLSGLPRVRRSRRRRRRRTGW